MTISTMRGQKFREVLEDLGYLVLIDANSRGGLFVRRANGDPIGFYSLNEDLTFRHGWVEHILGRMDCNTWPEFYERVTRYKP